MDMFDEARAMAGTLKLCRMTQTELARQMGVSQSYIANKLRLLGFSERVTEAIRGAGVSERHARSLLRLESEEEQLLLLKKVSEQRLTVRECEALVDSKVLTRAPVIIGRAERRRQTECFLETLKKSLEVLSESGITANLCHSRYGSKTYLTVSIEDE